MNPNTSLPLPLNQIAFSVIDLRRTEAWWREGLGFLPAGGNRLLFRGPLISAIQNVPGAAMTCWCLLGRNDWSQIEMFQYESPTSKLLPTDFKPNDIGYTRCGVWVADFDSALARLARLDTRPLAPPIGSLGQRRVCVRNPDGVYVELMEADPLPAQNRLGRQDCPVALRYVSMSTPDMARSLAFLVDGLGLAELDTQLHDDAHEALWGLAGAQCTRRVLGGPSLLLEVVEYQQPRGQPWRQGYRVCDQGILNICFGDPLNRHGVNAMHQRALKAGARANSRPIHTLRAGCVYANDPLGFSYEFMWAAPGRGHRNYGFSVLPVNRRPLPDNQRAGSSLVINAPAAELFQLVNDNAALSRWSGLGRFAQIATPSGAACGVGGERSVATPLGTLREQITAWQPGHCVRYRIVGSRLMRNHQGLISLAPETGGTRVTWIIRFRCGIPGLGGLLRRVMQGKLEKALAGLQQYQASHPKQH
ncbi:SRPBCC family protein [Pseudomonas sp. N040]|uniref:SRPBCC family protein n=1 Tax=Pseudomonas sp. N040 TaxID=2785325 RepID=UPI0018A24FED|nr:SRPBCC family protein [Pseudomonas sp. N040]MBF7729108.1 SRPBCC family protein [Pseudomonas sp. N040]MBW7012748.1 SRPBCC family protein [Pseudomonas sp. N040]